MKAGQDRYSAKALDSLYDCIFAPSSNRFAIGIEEIWHGHHERADAAKDCKGVVHTKILVEGNCGFDHATAELSAQYVKRLTVTSRRAFAEKNRKIRIQTYPAAQ